MCYNPIEDDVVRAKNQLKAAILFSQDNLSGMHCSLCSRVLQEPAACTTIATLSAQLLLCSCSSCPVKVCV